MKQKALSGTLDARSQRFLKNKLKYTINYNYNLYIYIYVIKFILQSVAQFFKHLKKINLKYFSPE